VNQTNSTEQRFETADSPKKTYEGDGEILLGKRGHEQAGESRYEFDPQLSNHTGSPELPSSKLGVTGSLLHMLGDCKLRTLRKIKKHPVETRLSPFAIQKTADGDEFEKRIIQAKQIWERLIRSKIKVNPGTIELFERENYGYDVKRKDPVKESKMQKAFIESWLDEHPEKPALFCQVRIREDDEENVFSGIVDMALWTGTNWYLGEIKSTTQPKSATALQLKHYRNIWANWAPNGDTTSEEVFIIHPQTGWQFQSKEAPTRQRKCIEASKITTFPLSLAKETHAEAMNQLQELHEMQEPPANITCSPINQECPECLYRISCYRRFAKDSQHEKGPHVSAAGLDQAEQDWLRDEWNITRTEEALDLLPKLGMIHEDNPILIDELREKLERARMLYGNFAWAAPKTSLTPVFFGGRKSAKHPEWIVGCEGEPSQTPDLKSLGDFILVAFTQNEVRQAYGKLFDQKITPKKFVCLQDDLEDETIMPFKNRSLRGILQTFEGIISHGSWAAYAEQELIDELSQDSMIPYGESEENPEDQETRVDETRRLWNAMHLLKQSSH